MLATRILIDKLSIECKQCVKMLKHSFEKPMFLLKFTFFVHDDVTLVLRNFPVMKHTLNLYGRFPLIA